MAFHKFHKSFSKGHSFDVEAPKSETKQVQINASNAMEVKSVHSAKAVLEMHSKARTGTSPSFNDGAEIASSAGFTELNSSTNNNDLSSLIASYKFNNFTDKDGMEQIVRYSLNCVDKGDVDAVAGVKERATKNNGGLNGLPPMGTSQTQQTLTPFAQSSTSKDLCASKALWSTSTEDSRVNLPDKPAVREGGSPPVKAHKAINEYNTPTKTSETDPLLTGLYVAVRVRPATQRVFPLLPSLAVSTPSSTRHRGDSLKQSVRFDEMGFGGVGRQTPHKHLKEKFLKTFMEESAVECMGYAGADANRSMSDLDEGLSASRQMLRFTYDAVFDETSTQEEVMRAIGEKAVDQVLAGYHGTVMCYGQSGCGKTYSLIGPQGGKLRACDIIRTLKREGPDFPRDVTPASAFSGASKDRGAKDGRFAYGFTESVGMLPRMLLRLFQRLEATTQSPLELSASVDSNGPGLDASWAVSLNAVELYNEELHDLIPNPISDVQRHRRSKLARKDYTGSRNQNHSKLFSTMLTQEHSCRNKKAEVDRQDSSLELSTGEIDSGLLGETLKGRKRSSSEDDMGLNLRTVGSSPHASPRRSTSLSDDKVAPLSSGHISAPSRIANVEGTGSQSTVPNRSRDVLYSSPCLGRVSLSPSPRLSGSLSLRSNQYRAKTTIDSKSPSVLRIRSTTGKSGGSAKRTSDSSLSVTIDGLRTHRAHNFQEAMQIVFQALLERKMAYTRLNINSNRAHTLFFVHVTQKVQHSTTLKHSILTLVDLAGSERVSHTGAEGMRLLEARKINLSLMQLGNVIRRLNQSQHRQHLSSSQSVTQQPEHIPYRSSILTRLLQDSFGGNAVTFLLCNVSPDLSDAQETLSTLRFACLANQIQNKPILNTQEQAAVEFAEENERLRGQLKEAQAYIAWLKTQAEGEGGGQASTTNAGLGAAEDGGDCNQKDAAACAGATEPVLSDATHQESSRASKNLAHFLRMQQLSIVSDENSDRHDGQGECSPQNEFLDGINMARQAEFAAHGFALPLRGLEVDRLAANINHSASQHLNNFAQPLSFLKSVDSVSLTATKSEKRQSTGRGADDGRASRAKQYFEDLFGGSNSLPTTTILQNAYGVLCFIRSLYSFLDRVSSASLKTSETKLVDKPDTVGTIKVGGVQDPPAVSDHHTEPHPRGLSLSHNISLRLGNCVIPYASRYFETMRNFKSFIVTKGVRGNSHHVGANDKLALAVKQCFNLKLLGYVDADGQVRGSCPANHTNQGNATGVLASLEKVHQTWLDKILYGFQLAATMVNKDREVMPL